MSVSLTLIIIVTVITVTTTANTKRIQKVPNCTITHRNIVTGNSRGWVQETSIWSAVHKTSHHETLKYLVVLCDDGDWEKKREKNI